MTIPTTLLLINVFGFGFLAGSVCMAKFDDRLRKKRGEKR